YLIRSECYIRNNKIAQGLNDLDTLLIKRYKSGTFSPLAISSQSEALNLVLNERRKEMVLRGMRWMDIKRLNKGGANITLKRVENRTTYSLQPNANFYALPLPVDIIQITGMQQNEP
ncbi:MAG TPA: RagB/SusD family nutrient uptake outer membrane protein, partial [Arachidicoccus soli]|nr:RagB/SusD family nutrient uptake outer membrane protein [Arachidicoccus soli]